MLHPHVIPPGVCLGVLPAPPHRSAVVGALNAIRRGTFAGEETGETFRGATADAWDTPATLRTTAAVLNSLT